MLAAFVDIERNIIECLEVRDDLREGERLCGLPYKIQCFMLGRRPESARPCIAMFCQSQKFCQRAARIIKGTSWWIEFDAHHPGFQFARFYGAAPPVRMGTQDTVGASSDMSLSNYGGEPQVFDDTLEHQDTQPILQFRQASQEHNAAASSALVYVSKTTRTLYGAPVFFPTRNLRTYQAATFGGIIFLESKPYGMTVAHCLATEAQHAILPALDDTSSYEPAFSFLDEVVEDTNVPDLSDTDYDMDSVSDISLSSSSEHNFYDHSPTADRSRTSQDMDSVHTELSVTINEEQLLLLGRVIQHSTGLPTDGLDWALIQVEPRWIPPFRSPISTIPQSMKVLSVLETTADHSDSDVCIIRNEVMLRGLHSPYPVCIRLPGATRMIHVSEVEFPGARLGEWLSLRACSSI